MRNLGTAVLALALLLGVTTPILANEVHGTIAWIEPADQTLTLVDDNNNVLCMRMVLTGDVAIGGENQTMWDLQPGERATVTLTDKTDSDGTLRATRIEGE
jgi:hypothetical protein